MVFLWILYRSLGKPLCGGILKLQICSEPECLFLNIFPFIGFRPDRIHNVGFGFEGKLLVSYARKNRVEQKFNIDLRHLETQPLETQPAQTCSSVLSLCVHSSHSWGTDGDRYTCVFWLRIVKLSASLKWKFASFSSKKWRWFIQLRMTALVTRQLLSRCLKQLAFVSFIPKIVTFLIIKVYAELSELWQKSGNKSRSPAKGHWYIVQLFSYTA